MCHCVTDPLCFSQMAIYGNYQDDYEPPNTTTQPLFLVPGFVVGCTVFESLLATSLECLYSNSSCLSTMIEVWLNETISSEDLGPIPPLDASMSTRFAQTDTILAIVSELMVEQWEPLLSFADYFQACAPSECSYSKEERRDLMSVFTILFSVFGGLSSLLRLFCPIIIRLFFRFMNKMARGMMFIHWRIENSLRKQILSLRFHQLILQFLNQLSGSTKLWQIVC